MRLQEMSPPQQLHLTFTGREPDACLGRLEETGTARFGDEKLRVASYKFACKILVARGVSVDRRLGANVIYVDLKLARLPPSEFLFFAREAHTRIYRCRFDWPVRHLLLHVPNGRLLCRTRRTRPVYRSCRPRS